MNMKPSTTGHGAVIRQAVKEDCMNLAALSIAVWLQTYSADGIRVETSEYAMSTFTRDYFLRLLADKKYRLLVAVDGTCLRGYALVNLASGFKGRENGFEIEKLYVHGPFRSKGIGQLLLREIQTRYGDRFWLYTWIHNESIAFYKKFGFKNIGWYDFNFGNDITHNLVLGYNAAKRIPA